MSQKRIVERRMTRSGVVALGIVGAHAGLITLLLHSVLTVPSAPAAPIVVSVIQSKERPAEVPKLASPELTRIQPLLIPPAEFAVATESPTIIAATVSETASKEKVSPGPAVASSSAPQLPAMSDIAYLKQPAPHYPPKSRRAREEGLVVLRVTIDDRGRVIDVEIQRSSGHRLLDEAARDAVSQALFKPYIDGGVARSASAIIPIEFSLRVSSS